MREGVYEGIGESERDKPGVVLLLDEPTAACDPATAKLVERAIVKSGVTVIWVTHDHAQTLRMAHKRLVLTLAHPTNTTTAMTTSTKSITSVAAAATSSSSSSMTSLSGPPTIKHPSLPVPATTTTTTTTITVGLTEEKPITATSNSIPGTTTNSTTNQSASTIATNSAIASSASSTTTIDEKNKSTIPTDATNSSTATTTLSEQQPNQSTQIQSSQPPQPPRRRFIQTYNRVELTFATHPPPLSKAYWGPIDASTFRVRGPTYLQGTVSHRQTYSSQHTLTSQTLTNLSHHPLSTPLPPPI